MKDIKARSYRWRRIRYDGMRAASYKPDLLSFSTRKKLYGTLQREAHKSSSNKGRKSPKRSRKV